MLSYIYMGTPPLAATILEMLCDQLYPPVAVVTQVAKASGRGQKIAATAVETSARTLDLNVFATLDVNSPATLGALATFEPDLILVAAFGQILKQDLLSLPKRYCLNVHASLLPRYRGAAPVQRAIWNGDTSTGITIQKMARKLDTGDILLQRQIPIEPEETSEELMGRLAILGGECLIESVKRIDANEETFIAQDESGATYAHKIRKEESRIDWNHDSRAILNGIRALQPWPIAETELNGEKLRVFRARLSPDTIPGKVGTVHTDHKTFLTVKCGDGKSLELLEVQLANRKRVAVREFLNSFRGNFPYRQMG